LLEFQTRIQQQQQKRGRKKKAAEKKNKQNKQMKKEGTRMWLPFSRFSSIFLFFLSTFWFIISSYPLAYSRFHEEARERYSWTYSHWEHLSLLRTLSARTTENTTAIVFQLVLSECKHAAASIFPTVPLLWNFAHLRSFLSQCVQYVYMSERETLLGPFPTGDLPPLRTSVLVADKIGSSSFNSSSLSANTLHRCPQQLHSCEFCPFKFFSLTMREMRTMWALNVNIELNVRIKLITYT
jgi:hypothetical protein